MSVSLTVRTRLPKARLDGILADLPDYITGKRPDVYGLGKAFKSKLAFFLYTKIREAYLVKSVGGTDELGYRWKPLKTSTLARRPKTTWEVRQKAANWRVKGRGVLTVGEDRAWKAAYRRAYVKLSAIMGSTVAKREAERHAWAALRAAGAAGAKNPIGLLGLRKRILIVTERLLTSLSPGRMVGNTYDPMKEQIYRSGWGQLELGSKVPYAEKQHKMRKLIPSATRITPWLQEGARQAVVDLTKELAKNL